MIVSKTTFLIHIVIVSFIEYIGDSSLKIYTRENKHHFLYIGLIAYMAMVFMLIKILGYANVIQMNIQWDAMSLIIETILAYIFLRETLTGATQYIAFLLVVSGLILMNFGKSSYN